MQMDAITELLKRTYYGNTMMDYLVFVVVIIVGFIAVKVVASVVFRALSRFTEGTENKLDDFLFRLMRKNLVPLAYYGVFFVALKNIALPKSIDRAAEVVGIILLTALGIRFISALVVYMVETYWLKQTSEDKARGYRGLMPAIKTVIWALGIIFLLDNLGFKISTVIAGLGIGGIAVAMASQAVLGDLFSYFAILTDRPFEVGDFVVVGEYMGTIEHIGIKTTRVRSLGGEQLIFSNSDLTGSRIRNYKRMERRRVVFKFGVIYQTPVEKLKRIPEMVKSIIAGIDGAECDRSHFASFGDSSLDFETVYYVGSGDYAAYMDVQQRINLELATRFESEDIEFAYPTRTVFIEQSGEGDATVPGETAEPSEPASPAAT